MKKIFITLPILILVIYSCSKKVEPVSTEINYPALFIINGESNTISVIKLANNTVGATIKLGEMAMPGHSMSMSSGIMWPHHLSLNADKTQIAIGVPGMDLSARHSGIIVGMGGKIALVDVMKGTLINVITVPSMNHNAIYNKTGTEIWTSQMENAGKVLVFNAATLTQTNTINVGMMPAEVTFSPDGSMAFVANGMDNTVSVINTSTKVVITTLGVGSNPVGAWAATDGNMYVDNEDAQTISIINISSMSVTGIISLGFMPGYVAHNSAKNELWVTDPAAGKVHYWIWDSAMKKWIHGSAFDTGAGAHAIAFTIDGNTAYITNQGAANVSVINTINHIKITDIAVGSKPNGLVIKQ